MDETKKVTLVRRQLELHFVLPQRRTLPKPRTEKECWLIPTSVLRCHLRRDDHLQAVSFMKCDTEVAAFPFCNGVDTKRQRDTGKRRDKPDWSWE
jgi:hypothetical protein